MFSHVYLRSGRVFVALVFSLLAIVPVRSFASEAKDSNASDVVSLAFDDWTLKCIAKENDASDHRCEISQVVAVEDEARTVEILSLAVSRSRNQTGKAVFTLVALTPGDIHLPSDFGLSADDAKLSLSRYRNCNRNGCFVIVPLSNQEIKRLKRATRGAALFRDLAGRPIKVTFSLKGFTKAFDHLATGIIPAAITGTGEMP